ncbi:L-alanine-DL-glutamate epimerase [Labilithrix luteola]|uniref:Dipeptide epimerase n=1 Tax=Labilithrix luteola TaxID=1391654 RepID=A0A0K1QCQ8_9BACT|nr:dipeptide epimerase [Labilithrix luteola]AKV03513.1 L-alanine-DL-glutamate epimerase [Labilithrix luteola]
MASSPGTTIVDLRFRPLDIAMAKAFGIAGGAQELARNVLVEVTLSSGVRGYGEAAPLPPFNGETQEGALAALEHAKARILGQDAAAWRALSERIRDAANSSASAACALETAVLDALVRALGTSLRVFFGGAEEKLVTDVTITTGTVEEAAHEARRFSAFETLKIKVGASDVDHDEVRVRTVHHARPDARLLLDANGGFSVDEAIRLAQRLARAGVSIALFEQPVAPGSWDALAEVRRETGLFVAADESVTSPHDVPLAVAAKAIDAVNIKLMKSGPAQALDIAAAARACGLRPMIGGMVEARLAMGTSACLAAGLGGFAFIDLDTPLFLADDPFDGGYRYEGAVLDLSPITLGHGCVPRA